MEDFMLDHLEIRNFALIENLEIDFSRGFNVITGETGAGKSIILGAMGLLLGEKADSQSVRNGADECIVNAILSIPPGHPVLGFLADRGIEPEDGAVSVRRVVKANGSRGLVSIQGQSVSRSELAALCDSLIDMHSQHEHQSLVHPDRQRAILDSYAGNVKLIDEYAQKFTELAELKQQKSDLEKGIETASREKDYLEFAVSEIRKTDPKIGEEQTIKEEIETLTHYEMLSESLQQCIASLQSSKDQIFDAQGFVTKALKADPSLSELSARIESMRIENEDLYETLRDRFEGMSFSQERLDSLQDRLSRIHKLRKYGSSIEDILAYADKSESMIKASENSEIELSKIDKKLAQKQLEMNEAASKVTDSRVKAAGVLQKAIEAVLGHLGMPSGKFRIVISPALEAGPKGADDVCFMISPNKGEDPRMISQIASGGELSRIMLAIKTVLAEVDDTQTQVFDEVDAGIGGAVAQAVGIELSHLARCRQVIAITHLASIAAMADSQFVVSKHEEGSRTFSCISAVTGEQRAIEIARMLSGDSSPVSLEHARALLNR